MSGYDGEFRQVITAAMRAHELNKGAKPLIPIENTETPLAKPTTLALEEIQKGAVKSYFTKPPIVKPERHLEDLAVAEIPLDVEDVTLEEEPLLTTDIFESEEETMDSGRKLPVQASLGEDFDEEEDFEEEEEEEEEDFDDDVDFDDDDIDFDDDDLDDDADDDVDEDE